jgi:hypothetical protein
VIARLRLGCLCALLCAAVLVAAQEPGVRDGAAELFGGERVPPPNERQHQQSQRSLTVTTAVPSAAEAQKIFGTNLYRSNVQPVWVQVRNDGDAELLLTHMGLDPDYYTPREATYRMGAGESRRLLNQRYEGRSMNQMLVPAHSVQSGYIFTQVDEGTKSFNVDVVGDGEPYMFTFFVPVPGLKIDHREVRFAELYTDEERRELTLQQLVQELEGLPCCVTDSSGKKNGDPLNLVIVGEALDLYYAFLRAGWDETETINRASLWRTGMSALTGGAYRYSPVSALYVFDRPQDVALQRARGSIHRRNHLRLWLTPYTLEGTPVWIGQISRDIGVRFTWRTITTHKIDANVDETRDFLLEDLAYADAVESFGFVGGVGAASFDDPRGNLTGDPYFTDGQRLMMWISGRSNSIAEVRRRDLESLAR